MYNWSVDLKHLKKYPKKFKIWKLEQLINFGLGKEKINKQDLKKYFKYLKIDPQKKEYLSTFLSSSK